MKTSKILLNSILILVILTLFSFTSGKKNKEHQIKITTEYGDIIIKLYNETPKHRDNFLKLTKENFYDSTLFHRVIKDFMIQGGDPNSKNAPAGKMLGNGGPGYTIPAEFNPKLYHKRGAIAAAREGDNVNPQRASSGSQFYIVWGKTFTNEQLKNYEKHINSSNKQLFTMNFINNPKNRDIRNKLDSLKLSGNTTEFQNYAMKIQKQIDKDFNKLPVFKYTPEQIKTYTTIGGTPHLDGAYTVFGEVIKGLDVVEKIINQPTNKNNRPLKDIKMSIKIIK